MIVWQMAIGIDEFAHDPTWLRVVNVSHDLDSKLVHFRPVIVPRLKSKASSGLNPMQCTAFMSGLKP